RDSALVGGQHTSDAPPKRPKPNTDTGGEFLRCLQGRKGGAACLRPRRPCEPPPQPHDVQGGSRRQMLQMGSGEPSIACVPEATPADTLRVGALDACPWRILLRAGVGRLPLSGGLQRLVRLPGFGPSGAGALLR